MEDYPRNLKEFEVRFGVRRRAESIWCNYAGRMDFAVRDVGAERVRRLGRSCCGVVTVGIKPR
jgi:hypothetical protein